MGRLPFEPKKMRGPKKDDGPITVSQLARRIGDTLASGLPDRIRVTGEVSGFRERTHWYFDLKDAGAVVNCVMFASSAAKAGFTPEPGQQVVASGKVDFYAKGGRTSFVVDRLEPVGAGALELEFRRLCEELRGLGYFDPGRKRDLPVMPRKIAVVTSRTGAALQDVLDTAKRLCPAVAWLVVDARVQGERAAPEVARAIRALGERTDIDAILVTRGGGSTEDLWAFNERAVADAVFESPLPVVCAIGHETDTTIAELVADRRAATPTQAAMMLVPNAASMLEQLDTLARGARRALERRAKHDQERVRSASRLRVITLGYIRDARLTLGELSQQLERHRPAAAQARRASRLDAAALQLRGAVMKRLATTHTEDLGERLDRTIRRRARRSRERAAYAARTLRAVGPESVLDRGYSWTIGPGGKVLRSPGEVKPGERLTTRLADGSVESTVAGPGSAPPVRRRNKAPDPNQMDLFGKSG